MGRLNLRPEMLKLKSWHHMKIGEERCFCERQNKQRNAGDDIETENCFKRCNIQVTKCEISSTMRQIKAKHGRIAIYNRQT